MMDYRYYDELAKVVEFVDGKPYWTEDRSSKIKSGDLAGTKTANHRYRYIGISLDGIYKTKAAHRLNFYMCHGYLPEMIDHADRDTDNNRIENLRPCTRSENMLNCKKRAGCSSSYRGVSIIRRANGVVRWLCESYATGSKVSLGTHDTEIEAAVAYNEYIISNINSRFVELNVIG